ncbi:DUF262 domain-containing protein [Helcococcus kunzii]|uniref:DUF262 domain-containing protein n=1 Tax=Helcococcus kunzii TaxID=40091 RepID=UPI0038A83D36
MKGNEQLLYQYMEGSSKRFIIPVYQRNYDWKIEQCKQLFDDLIRLSKNGLKRHFFGSIVSSMAEDAGQQDFLIIDGQQRLTTVSLLLLAMYKLLDENVILTDDETLKTRLLDEYLVDKYAPKETRIKLKPVKNDATAFNALVDKHSNPIESSNITTNYEYFYNRIQKGEITVSELYESFKKLEIINIFLSQEDNPQLIFESLNSTGLDLSEGDKIRNYILMDVKPTTLQEEYYERYWHPLEKATNFDVTFFIRDYLSIKLQSIPVIKKTYQEFKKYFINFKGNKVELLEDLLAYSKRYEQLIKGKSSVREIEPALKRLLFYEATVTRPFLMQVLKLSESKDNEKPVLETKEVVEILSVVESYIFRRQVCDIPTNSLNKIFATLHNDIVQIDKTTTNYLEKFKYILAKKQGNGIFPDDSMFLENLSNKQVYMMRSKNKQYIMDRYENWGTKEVKNVYDFIKDGTYSIEHIMPQTLSREWQSYLGENWQKIHEIWVHRLANLTLTAYNAKYQNSSFIKKRDVENGFKDSGLRMNQRLANYDKWTEVELEDRNKNMLSKAVKIWPMVNTDYKPAENIDEKVSLADDYSLTGKLINGYEYFGAYTSVKNWQEMYLGIIEIIVEDNPQILINQVNQKENDLQYYFDNHQSKENYKKIYDGIFVNTNTSTNTKIIGLKQLFELYGIDENELVFVLKTSEDSLH